MTRLTPSAACAPCRRARSRTAGSSSCPTRVGGTSPSPSPRTPDTGGSLAAVTAATRGVLEEARARGFLGPGPVDAHVAHAWPLVGELPSTGELVDLGSGGGVPGLVLAAALPGTRWVLIESRQRRAAWLHEAAATLGLAGRVSVVAQRAEVVGRSACRGQAAAVVARAFGPPAVSAECAAPLLAPQGTCWVAEPPGGAPERWP